MHSSSPNSVNAPRQATGQGHYAGCVPECKDLFLSTRNLVIASQQAAEGSDDDAWCVPECENFFFSTSLNSVVAAQQARTNDGVPFPNLVDTEEELLHF